MRGRVWAPFGIKVDATSTPPVNPYRPIARQHVTLQAIARMRGRIWMPSGNRIPPPPPPPINPYRPIVRQHVSAQAIARMRGRIWVPIGARIPAPPPVNPYRPIVRQHVTPRAIARMRGTVWMPSGTRLKPPPPVNPYRPIVRQHVTARTIARMRGGVWTPSGARIATIPTAPLIPLPSGPLAWNIARNKRRVTFTLGFPPGVPSPPVNPYRPIARQHVTPLAIARMRGTVWMPSGNRIDPVVPPPINPYQPIALQHAETQRVARVRGSVWMPSGARIAPPPPQPTPSPLAWNVVRRRPRAIFTRGSTALPKPAVLSRPIVQIAAASTARAWRHGRVCLPVLPSNAPLPPSLLSWSIARSGPSRQALRRYQPKISAQPPLRPALAQPHQWQVIQGGQPRRRGHAIVATNLVPPRLLMPGWRIAAGGQLRRRGHVNPTGTLPPGTPARSDPPLQTHVWHIAAGGQPRRRGVAATPSRLASPLPPLQTHVWSIARGGQPRRRGRVWQSPITARPAGPPPPVPDLPRSWGIVSRAGERRPIIALRGQGWHWYPPPLAISNYIVGYHVYANTGIGDPIDYNVPIATILGFGNTGYQVCNLSYPGIWSFGVRAFNQFGEEENVDAVVTIVLDVNGNDITARPLAPTGLNLFPMSAGNLRATWSYPPVRGPKTPTGFHVYLGTGGVVNYRTPVATVLYGSAIVGSFLANLTGLTGGTTYIANVRAYNATGEEPNNNTASATADAVGPAAVDALTATATAIG